MQQAAIPFGKDGHALAVPFGLRERKAFMQQQYLTRIERWAIIALLTTLCFLVKVEAQAIRKALLHRSPQQLTLNYDIEVVPGATMVLNDQGQQGQQAGGRR